ncbi:MAG: hypothetical protein JWR75_853 [Devosia sp.]|nr:hypothetical protein [Devosia sp.]
MTNRQRLIFHVGLPKTATSAIQWWCFNNRDQLLQHGIRYADISSKTNAPKQQYLVSALKGGKLAPLARQLEKYVAGPPLLFSTEGLTNHLYDFPPEALQRFRELTAAYDVTVFVVFRDPAAWVKSWYKQLLLNPPRAEYHYGSSMNLAEFSRLPRVLRLIDRSAIKADLERAFGAKTVVTAEFEGDWPRQLLGVLGVNGEMVFAAPAANVSIPDWQSEIVRQINGFAIDPALRKHWLALLQFAAPTNHAELLEAAASIGAAGVRQNIPRDALAQLRPGQWCDAMALDRFSAAARAFLAG